MASRALTDLVPTVRSKVESWVSACEARGVSVLVYCTLRSAEEQAALYQIGRTVPPIGKIVTNAPAWSSAHQYGRAVDAVPTVHGKPLWRAFPSNSAEQAFRASGELRHLVPEWAVFAEEAERAGLEWAGRWKSFREYVHVQALDGMTIAQLYAQRNAA